MAPNQPASIGETVLGNRYKVGALIGEGSAASVYEVRDLVDGSSKVAKILKPESVASHETLRRFEDEYRILRMLHHPNLPEVYSYGHTDSELRYMIMELVEGQPLEEYHRNHPDDLWVILYQLCEVLTFVHARDLLHQDIKPNNILVTRTTAFGEERPLVMLMDFGLTYRRNIGMKVSLVGTAEYMAPEIIRGETPLTRAVDYYSLGATLYELVEGKPPFTGKTKDVLESHLYHSPQFRMERLEYTEVYGHIRSLMTKDKMERLTAFEDLRSSALNHVAGGISELERAYALAFIDSADAEIHAPARGTVRAWARSLRRVAEASQSKPRTVLSICGERGAGKTWMARECIAEAQIVGIEVLTIDTATQNRGESIDSAEARFRNSFVEEWERLASSIFGRGLLIVADDWERLSPETIAFLDYMATRREIERTNDSGPQISFLVVVGATNPPSLRERLHVDSAEIVLTECPPLTDAERQQFITLFKERLDGQIDKSRFDSVLSGMPSTPGGIASVVRRLVRGEIITARAGRWTLRRVPDMATFVDDTQREQAVFIFGRLNANAQELVLWLACCNSYLHHQILADVSHLAKEQLSRAIEDLQRLRVAQNGQDYMGEYLDLTYQGLRMVAYESMDAKVRSVRHRVLASAYTRSAISNDSRIARLVAYQYRQLSDVRSFLRTLLPWVSRRSRADDITQSRTLFKEIVNGIRSLLKEEDKAWPLERFALRQWLKTEYDHGALEEIIEIYQRYFVAKKRVPPFSLIKYIGDAYNWSQGSEEFHAIVIAALRQIGNRKSEPYIEIAIVDAGTKNMAGASSDARSILQTFLPLEHKLCALNRLRLHKQIVLVEDTAGDLNTVIGCIDNFSRVAQDAGADNDVLLAELIKANTLFGAARYEESLSLVKHAVRIATRRGLRNRLITAYFIASAVYYERGDYQRALRYVTRASDIAASDGRAVSVCAYIARMAMISEKLAQYGNVIRYLRKSREIGTRFALSNEMTKVLLFELEVLGHISHPEAGKRLRELESRMKSVTHESHRAYFEFVRGEYYAGQDWRKACKHYERAMEISNGLGHVDDEARAGVRLSYSLLAQREYDRVEELLEVISNQARNIGPHTIHAELAMVRLALSYVTRRKVNTLDKQARHCSSLESALTDIPLKIDMNMLIFRAYARLGNEELAQAHFDQFYRLMKGAMSSFGDSKLARRYFERCGGPRALEEYKLLSERVKTTKSH